MRSTNIHAPLAARREDASAKPFLILRAQQATSRPVAGLVGLMVLAGVAGIAVEQAQADARIVNPREVAILQALLGVEPLEKVAPAEADATVAPELDPVEIAKAKEAAEKAAAVEEAKAAERSVRAARKAKAEMAAADQGQARNTAPAPKAPTATPPTAKVIEKTGAHNQLAETASIAEPPIKNAAVKRSPVTGQQPKTQSPSPKVPQAAPFGGTVGLS